MDIRLFVDTIFFQAYSMLNIPSVIQNYIWLEIGNKIYITEMKIATVFTFCGMIHH